MDISLENTCESLRQRMEQESNALPVFSASVNRIQQISADPDSDAMALAMEAMKDANLSARLLRIANSPYYNRTGDSIASISRAVVLLGFNTIRSLTLGLTLVESFQNQHPGVDMASLLTSSLLSADYVRELATKCGMADIEESYVCALLYNLGEIIVANYLPDTYLQIRHYQKDQNCTAEEAQTRFLGGLYHDIGQWTAEQWGFPRRVINSMDVLPKQERKRVGNTTELNHAIVAMANSVFRAIYSNGAGSGAADEPIDDLLKDLAEITGLKQSALTKQISESFDNTRKLARAYGINESCFIPTVADTGDAQRDQLARNFSFQVRSELEKARPDTAGSTTATDQAARETTTTGTGTDAQAGSGRKGKPAASPVTAGNDQERLQDMHGDPNLQLQYLREITALMTEQAGIHRIFVKVLEALHEGIGFERVLLCLLSTDHKRLIGRIGMGADSETLKTAFDYPINGGNSLFTTLLLNGSEQLVDIRLEQDWIGKLPQGFREQVGSESFVAAGLRSSKPLGLIYADNAVSGRAVTNQDFHGFMQFVSQARLAMRLV